MSRVSKVPTDTGSSGWQAILPRQVSALSLEKDISTDWLIIGAGFAGLAAARRLAQQQTGDKITLIEASGLADGPAGRNSGFMIDLPHDLNSSDYTSSRKKDLTNIKMNRAAIEFARQTAQEAGLIDTAFKDTGKVNAAATQKGQTQLKKYSQHLTALNESFKHLSAQQMKSLTGLNFYKAGLFTPGTAMLQPAAFIQGVAKNLANKVTIYEQTPALEISSFKGIHKIKTPKATITTPKVILAVNGHVESFGYFKKHLMHLFTYASMSRKLTRQECLTLNGEANWQIISADPMGTTVRRISGELYGGDRIVIRNRFTYNPSMQITQKALKTIANQHQKCFQQRFVMLKDVTMEYSWGGRLCLSRNSAPAFGEVETGIYSAACQNGLGTVKGTLAGMLAADLALNNNSQMLNYYLCNQPSKLFPEPFMSLGVKSVLRWKEQQAGREL